MSNHDWARLPHLGRANAIEQAIQSLEGWSFGKWLQFACIGYDDQLHISLGGWKEIERFKHLPGIREFAEDLNKAMAPVLEAYAAQLRDELAKELLKVVGKARDVEAGNMAAKEDS